VLHPPLIVQSAKAERKAIALEKELTKLRQQQVCLHSSLEFKACLSMPPTAHQPPGPEPSLTAQRLD